MVKKPVAVVVQLQSSNANADRLAKVGDISLGGVRWLVHGAGLSEVQTMFLAMGFGLGLLLELIGLFRQAALLNGRRGVFVTKCVALENRFGVVINIADRLQVAYIILVSYHSDPFPGHCLLKAVEVELLTGQGIVDAGR